MNAGSWSLRATAFLTRSIRQESRLFSHHLMRGGLASVILMLFLMQLWTSSLFGAAGSRFAGAILNAFYWFLTLVGLLYFSTAITEEKEEDTLPLLRMTGVSNFALLVGKSAPRLAMSGLFLLVVSPFLVLSITMGGVVMEQLAACLLGLACYSFLLSQMGLLASTLASDSRRAFSLAAVLWILAELGHYLLWAASAGLSYNHPIIGAYVGEVSAWMSERALFSQMANYRMSDRGDAVWYPQMTAHLIAGAGLFLISMLSFERFNSRVIGQGLAPDISHRPLFQRTGSRLSARAVGNAFVWKSWHFQLGGQRWMLIRMIGLPLLVVLIVAVIGIMVRDVPPPEAYATALMITAVVTLLVELARNFGRVLNEEIFRQTLVSLKMVPTSTASIVGGLVLGITPVAMPAIVCFGSGWGLLAIFQPQTASDFLEVWQEPWYLHLFTWVLVTLHLGVLLSVYLRYGGMVLAAAALWIAAPVMLMMAAFTIGFMLPMLGNLGESMLRYAIPVGLMTIELLMCLVLQQWIVRRVDRVTEQ